MWCCNKQYDLSKAIAIVMNHQEEEYLKRIVVRIMQNYANTTTNDIDNALVDEIEKRLFPIDRRERERDILIHLNA